MSRKKIVSPQYSDSDDESTSRSFTDRSFTDITNTASTITPSKTTSSRYTSIAKSDVKKRSTSSRSSARSLTSSRSSARSTMSDDMASIQAKKPSGVKINFTTYSSDRKPLIGGNTSETSCTEESFTVTDGTDTETYCTVNGPTELRLKRDATEKPESVEILTEVSLGKARPNKYPDEIAGYTDKTNYDRDTNLLDIGYQRLKRINPSNYKSFSSLVRLNVDHNNLTQLPDPSLLPNLCELDCSFNQLSTIPFYPSLLNLIIKGNRVKSCREYDRSSLIYFDFSMNIGFDTKINLHKCIHLFGNDCCLTTFSLDYYGSLMYLDLSSNNLVELVSNKPNQLIELSVTNNRLSSIPSTPHLLCLFADNNQIVSINTMATLTTLEISDNLLTELPEFPRIVRLVANNNRISRIGGYQSAETIDLSYNSLEHFSVTSNLAYLYLHFNPMKTIELKDCQSMREMQINFDTYMHIYMSYYDAFESVQIKPSGEKISEIVTKLYDYYPQQIVSKLSSYFMGIDFPRRKTTIVGIGLRLHCAKHKIDIDKQRKKDNLASVVNTPEFKRLLKLLDSIYHNSLIVNLYFNGYRY
jgi:Leucine-rich repeat (LRR) protein